MKDLHTLLTTEYNGEVLDHLVYYLVVGYSIDAAIQNALEDVYGEE